MSNTKSASQKRVTPSRIWAYSPFPQRGEFFLRDPSGECFKAILQGSSFVWVEIDPTEFEAANEDRH